MSPLRTQIPMDLQRNCWITAINSQHNGHIEPITAQFCYDEIVNCQDKLDDVMIELTFHRKINPVTKELNQYRSMSDQIGRSSPIMRNSPTVSHIVALPERPSAEKTIFQAMKSPMSRHWKKGLWNQYDKNDAMMVLSRPIPKCKIPKDAKIFQSILACRIKEKGTNLYKFDVRLCLHGGPMEQGKDFDFSYSPTIGHTPLRAVICQSASLRRRLSILDVSNCFQSDSIELERRLYMRLPHKYLEWFAEKYPQVEYEKDPNGEYVIQTINNLQGRKDAGRSWYLLLVSILDEFGLTPCPAEPALFTYYDGEEALVVVTSTDDFLCSYTDPGLFSRLITHLQQYVSITAQDATIIKYLNCRIIQTDQGTSFDQTHHIQTTICDKWFPKDSTERIKTADTPYRTDSKYEKAIVSQLPATPKDLTH